MLAQLEEQLRQYPATQYWLGLSGGLDSCVLLHMLHSLKVPVCAVHVHHGLSHNADYWAQFCADICQKYKIPFTLKKVTLQHHGRGIEDAARRARYQAFNEELTPGDVLLLAHHSDDQNETFFMRALRGSGVNGLACMQNTRPLQGALLLRPLLSMSRKQLEVYAQQHGLVHIHDESNDNHHFERNYWRHEILPKLWQRFPAGPRGLQNTLQALQQDKSLLAELMLPVLQKSCAQDGSLSLDVWRAFSELQRVYVLRHWISSHHMQLPAQKVLQQIQQQLFSAVTDSDVCIRWQGYEIRRYRQQAFCMAVLPAKPPVGLRLDLHDSLPLGRLCCGTLTDCSQYHIRFYAGGESIHPAKRPVKSLKKLFQEQGIPPWLRDFWPLIYQGDELCCIPGVAIAEHSPSVLQELHWQVS